MSQFDADNMLMGFVCLIYLYAKRRFRRQWAKGGQINWYLIWKCFFTLYEYIEFDELIVGI